MLVQHPEDGRWGVLLTRREQIRAERVNIPASAIYCRLYRGWNARRTLTTPLRVTRRPEMVTP